MSTRRPLASLPPGLRASVAAAVVAPGLVAALLFGIASFAPAPAVATAAATDANPAPAAPRLATDPPAGRPESACAAIPGAGSGRTVCADVAAIDQILVYNRFGSFNPFGMIFALTRDLSSADLPPVALDADECAALTGTEIGVGPLTAGAVRLKDCKRPRPLVLRANPGDVLHLHLRNLLRPEAPDFSSTFCRQADAPSPRRSGFFAELRRWIRDGGKADSPDGGASALRHGEVDCITGRASPEPETAADWPRSRGLNFAIQGLTAIGPDGGEDGVDRACVGLTAIAPNEAVDCYYRIEREGPYFMTSTAAPSGGEGDGGSITHGLFGAVIVEPIGSRWLRSQVTRAAFDAVWPPASGSATDPAPPHARAPGAIDGPGRDPYATVDGNGVPLLELVMARGAGAVELVHADLNAVVHRPAGGDQAAATFREFSVFFHDELKTFTTRNFSELGQFGQLAGVRDGFAINYGASGMGSILLANRKGIGPAATCKECFYEEFFLTSWANGDPALLETFADDPSNVHHSYLNDRTVFRNFHAGPKETHVFHLHAHQWFSGNDAGRGSYLDSQTVGPQQGFTYDIYDGGLKAARPDGVSEADWSGGQGSGNRNRTVGDSIFHCHLYPHFAQGMWELWRVHDVLEDGSRVLPDGQLEPGLSLAEVADPVKRLKRPGSVDPRRGQRIVHGGPEGSAKQRFIGTPIPALVPLPGQPWPLLPTYPDEALEVDPRASASRPVAAEGAGTGTSEAAEVTTMPGYPFYIAGRPGHRPPQAPMDLALATGATDGGVATVRRGDPLDGGLPRHVVTDDATRELPVKPPPGFAPPPTASTQAEAGADPATRLRERQQAQYVAKLLALGDMTARLPSARLELLDAEGTPLERAAMGFHGDGRAWRGAGQSGSPLVLRRADGTLATAGIGGYASVGGNAGALFQVNGSPPSPGAPFADPCAIAPRALPQLRRLADPLRVTLDGPSPMLTLDPKLIGFRRYEASAVQVDLVTNRAGWHDPQGRINVLSALSDDYKAGGPTGTGIAAGRFTPKVSANEEPFFFRALSGECIEFRHTNELPKELELDDFQLRTPTDTIGQHIHLVKFDVTSSDGSANGFNYEDGTFAPDEIAARICAARTAGMETHPTRPAAPGTTPKLIDWGRCEPVEGRAEVGPAFKDIWRKRRSLEPHLFQTTIQRWFADPILSAPRAAGDTVASRPEDRAPVDRTLRTVFSHDHFGASSIQQHGFYSALVIEPADAIVCDPAPYDPAKASAARQATVAASDDATRRFADCTEDPRGGGDLADVRPGEPLLTGARRVIARTTDGAEAHDAANYREFALAIADFATLYDPRDNESQAAFEARFAGVGSGADTKGIETLACEAAHADDPQALGRRCGSAIGQDAAGYFSANDVPPAWVAAGRPGDTHNAGLLGWPDREDDANRLRDHLINWRRMAAGYPAVDAPELATDKASARLARPVAAPARPESISVDHHDPYLVNYRGEPLPLRIGRGQSGEACALKAVVADWVLPLSTGVTEHCSITRQRIDEGGDLARVFQSAWPRAGTSRFVGDGHGDPATPVLESYHGERIQVRLIQGAQEVQHSFHLEGHFWSRNTDQRFPSLAHEPETITPTADTLTRACARRDRGDPALRLARGGRVDEYADWLHGAFGNGSSPYWNAYESWAAECPNVDGIVSAQEVGISEHFEFAGTFRIDGSALEARLSDRLLTPTAADSLFHFGSQDALWNGAWGLLRVHRDEGSADPGPAPEGDEPIPVASNRLARLPSTTEPSRIAAICPDDAPLVRATLVAVEAHRVLGPVAALGDEGTPYGETLHDRNGLFLALAPPLTGGTTADLIGAIRRAYARPEPLALHVNAGDCLELTFVNALQARPGSRPAGLKDDLGDAPMPRITALNVEPTWCGAEACDGDDYKVFRQQDRFNLRPSARLALGIDLPLLGGAGTVEAADGKPPAGTEDAAMTATGTAPATEPEAGAPDGAGSRRRHGAGAWPFGYNPVDALSPVGAGPLAANRPVVTGTATGDNADPDRYADPAAGIEVRRYYAGRVAPAEMDPANPLAARPPHWIPYAFGPVAIRPMGDMIGQVSHGLFGAIVVHPRQASFDDASAGQCLVEAGREQAAEPICIGSANTAMRTGDGRREFTLLRPPIRRDRSLATIAYRAAEGGTEHRVRYQVVFFQDGLNLRDRATRDVHLGFDPATGRPASPRLMSDCRVCDDSYDLGDVGINYRSAPFHVRLRDEPGLGQTLPPERHTDLNRYDFGPRFFLTRPDETGLTGRPSMLVTRAEANEEVVFGVIHPGGRARQRSFVTIGQHYNDLFPGFGFPNGALLAPGKSVVAALSNPVARGCYLWQDGASTLRSGGSWGLIDVVPAGAFHDRSITSCAR